MSIERPKPASGTDSAEPYPSWTKIAAELRGAGCAAATTSPPEADPARGWHALLAEENGTRPNDDDDR